MTDSATVIDTPAAFAHYRHCQLIAALSIEVRTGMSHSHGSVMNVARAEYGITMRTKAGVLAELRRQYAECYGREYRAK